MEDYMAPLKQLRIWCCWIWKQVENSKPSKKLIASTGGPSGTSPNWSHTWVTYEEAVEAVEAIHAAGVGFVIPEGYFFLDADHYELEDPFIQLLLERFNSYTERSVSGGGIHIYGKCDLNQLPITTDKDGRKKIDSAYYVKNPGNNLELYIGGLTNRFAVYTGDVVWEEPLRECTAAVLTTLKCNMLRSAKPKKASTAKVAIPEKSDGSTGGNEAVWDIICDLLKQKNGDKFRRLFYDGDITGYGSQSEADATLCSMTAFRTGPEPELINAVFKESALYREKWEREDYRTATIQYGIDACGGVFHKSKMPHPYFIKFSEETGQPYVSAPLLAKYVREHLCYLLVRDSGKQGLLKYVYEGGCYKLYSTDMFLGVIKQYIADYDEELVKMSKVNEAYQHIVTDLTYIGQDDLNADEDIINFRNGLLSLKGTTPFLIPHTPEVLSTIQIPCDWIGRETPTPVFDRYLNTLTNGDPQLQQLLLEFIGACISNIKGWRMKKSLFLVGDGNTGKSQLKSLVERLLGKGNYIGIDLKEIEARFGTGAVYGTRLAGSSDMSFLTVDELKTFKKMTGGDSLYAEFKGQQAFEYTYNGLLWFCMNRLPKFGGDDGQWVYDRIVVVNCPNVIPIAKQDKQLLDKMYAERDGIVYKAVTALQTVIGNGYRFSEPESVVDARKEYQHTNSTVVSFFEECMCPWPRGRIQPHCTTGRIFKVYRAWCQDNNQGYAKTAKEFREELAAYLGTTFAAMTTRQKGNTYYRDYTLTQESKVQYQREYGFDGTEFLSAG